MLSQLNFRLLQIFRKFAEIAFTDSSHFCLSSASAVIHYKVPKIRSRATYKRRLLHFSGSWQKFIKRFEWYAYYRRFCAHISSLFFKSSEFFPTVEISKYYVCICIFDKIVLNSCSVNMIKEKVGLDTGWAGQKAMQPVWNHSTLAFVYWTAKRIWGFL